MARSEVPERTTAGVRRWRHRLRLAIAGLGVLALVAGTWLAAVLIQSPAQRDAAAAPPSAQPVVAQVIRGDLRDEVTAMSTVTAAQSTDAALALPGDGRAVVTRRGVDPGDTLTAGTVALWVNGRPVIVLSGDFPTYRDLTQGDTGDDVLQLQHALVGLGYALTADGDFGPATADALRRLYRSIGGEVTRVTRTTSGSVAGSEGTTSKDNPQGSDGATGTGGSGTTTGATGQTLVTVPQSEVLFISGLTDARTVLNLPAQGAVLTETNAVVSLAGGSPQIQTEVTAAVAASLAVGATASTSADDGTTINLQIASITEKPADTSTTDQGSGAGTFTGTTMFTIVFEQLGGAPLPLTTGSTPDLLVTIQRTQPVTDAVLVPKRALAAAPDGSYTVLAQSVDGGFTTKPVTVLACVGGRCALDEQSGLSEGDAVRVDGS